MLEILKAIFLGIVEGITEWLPVSSTGHMILVDEFLQLNASEAFKELFFVVIQFGAILAVLTVYWKRFVPLKRSRHGHLVGDSQVFRLWLKIIIACVPAAVVGILFDDQLNALFYNFQTVGIALIVFGIAFIGVENRNAGQQARVMRVHRHYVQRCVHYRHVPADRRNFPGNFALGRDHSRQHCHRRRARRCRRIYVFPCRTGHVRCFPAQVCETRMELHRV